MAKYLLARGQKRLPIEGVRVTLRENDRPLRQTEMVVFSPGRIVESDLDFGSWVVEGVIVRVDPPAPPGSVVAPPQAPVRPVVLPVPAQVEVIKEPPAAESHLSTKPRPMPHAAPLSAPIPAADLADAGVVLAPIPEEIPAPDPVLAEGEGPEEPEPIEEEALAGQADAPRQGRTQAKKRRR